MCQNPQSGGASGNNRKVSNSTAKGDSAFQLPALGGRLGPCAERLKKRATKGTTSGWIFKTGGCGELGGIRPGGEGRDAAAFWGTQDRGWRWQSKH